MTTLLYEKLIRHLDDGDFCDLNGEAISDRASMVQALRDATVVVVDNVADFYYVDSPQERWQLTADFPNVAPPWPNAFFEWNAPTRVNEGGIIRPCGGMPLRYGLLMSAMAIHIDDYLQSDTYLTEHNAARFAVALIRAKAQDAGDWAVVEDCQTINPDELWRTLTDEQKEISFAGLTRSLHEQQSQRVKWIVQCMSFAESQGQVLSLTYFVYNVTEAGKFFVSTDQQGQFVPMSIYNMPRIARRLAADAERGKALLPADQATILHVPLLAICLSHCKNVKLDDVVTPPKLAHKQYKKHGIRKVIHKVLVIDPMRRVLERDGKSSQTGIKRAMHICRGHFATYTQRGLFGKHTGTFWRPMHTRGSRDHGEVHKSYEVRSGVPEAAK